MSGRRGLFRRRRVLASAGRRSHRTDGAGGLPESGAGRCHARARRAERFRGDAALAALLRSDWRRLGTRARVAEGAARALDQAMTRDTLAATKTRKHPSTSSGQAPAVSLSNRAFVLP